MHIYAPCSRLVYQLLLWQKRNLLKNSLGQMLGSRAAKRARLAAANNAAGVNPMMAMGMNPLMASMFPGMMSGMQGRQQMPGMPGMPGMMPGVQQQQDDASESEQEENTGSNGSNHAPSVAAMSMAAAPAAQPAPAAPAGEVGAPEDFHSTLLSDAAISRSCTYLKNVPRNRLSDCLERMDASLEATYTAELSSNGLLALLWVWTRMKPGVKVSDLSHSAAMINKKR